MIDDKTTTNVVHSVAELDVVQSKPATSLEAIGQRILSRFVLIDLDHLLHIGDYVAFSRSCKRSECVAKSRYLYTILVTNRHTDYHAHTLSLSPSHTQSEREIDCWSIIGLVYLFQMFQAEE